MNSRRNDCNSGNQVTLTNSQVKVYITSCESGEGAWTTHEQKLKALYELSNKQYTLIDDPNAADILLIGEVREENWGQGVLGHPLIKRFPSHCFSLCDQDNPVFIHHGLYASNRRSWLSAGRVHTSAYTLISDPWGNPYIQKHSLAATPAVEKQMLLTFIGRNCHRVRNAIFALKFEREDIQIEDSSAFNLWGADAVTKDQRHKYFYDMLLGSKFSLCPRGNGTGSMRLFESMALGVAPVIISDGWIFPRGPSWNSFSIVVRERDVCDLERIVVSYETSYEEMGRLARRAYEQNFSESAYFNYVVDNCLQILAEQRVPEILYWRLAPWIVLVLRTRATLRPKALLRRILNIESAM